MYTDPPRTTEIYDSGAHNRCLSLDFHPHGLPDEQLKLLVYQEPPTTLCDSHLFRKFTLRQPRPSRKNPRQTLLI